MRGQEGRANTPREHVGRHSSRHGGMANYSTGGGGVEQPVSMSRTHIHKKLELKWMSFRSFVRAYGGRRSSNVLF